MKTELEKKVNEARKELNAVIRSCKAECKGLSEYDHDRIDLEGKIYAYEFARDCILDDMLDVY